uniref:tryptophan 7-halogenase n=1 Tax=Shewanella gaetbuli TaxID=220752 RepID=UPI003B5BD5C4
MKKILIISDHQTAAQAWFVAAKMQQKLKASEICVEHVFDTNPTIAQGAVTICEEAIDALVELGFTRQHLFNPQVADLNLATKYVDWFEVGSAYHTQSELGVKLEGVDFHHYLYEEFKNEGLNDLTEFSLTALAAKQGKRILPSSDPKSILSSVSTGLNIEAKYLINLLRQVALYHGVKEHNAQVEVKQWCDNRVEGVTLKNGQQLSADFYIDLSAADLPSESHEWHRPFSQLKPVYVTQTVSVSEHGAGKPVLECQKNSFGWQKTISINKHKFTERVSTNMLQEHVDSWNKVTFDYLTLPWAGNCLQIGSHTVKLIDIHGLELVVLNQQIDLLLRHFPNPETMTVTAQCYNEENTRLMFMYSVFTLLPFINIYEGFQVFENNLNVSELNVSDISFDQLEDGNEFLAYLVQLFQQTGCFPELEYQLKPKSYWISLMLAIGVTPLAHNLQAQRLSKTELNRFIEKVRLRVINTANAIK